MLVYSHCVSHINGEIADAVERMKKLCKRFGIIPEAVKRH